MAVLRNLHPEVLQKIKKKHEELYCSAKLEGRKHWSINDTLEYLMADGL